MLLCGLFVGIGGGERFIWYHRLIVIIFVPMKQRGKGERKQYPTVNQLPASALSVANYANDNNITVSYVYKQYKQGKLKIIDFQGYNFVVNNQ
jgi:hypothetical protein